jgi:hypothetical protein
MGEFANQVRAFRDATEAKATLAVRKIALEIMTRVVQRSPVGNPELWASNKIAAQYNHEVNVRNAELREIPENLTKAGRLKRGKKVKDSMPINAPPGYVGGRFRGNWLVSIGSPLIGEIDRVDPSGNDTIAAARAVLQSLVAGTPIFIVNNLPYGPRLEYESWSKQAPAGMLRITVAEFQDIVQQVGASLSNTSE